jgi:hypothetical protein
MRKAQTPKPLRGRNTVLFTDIILGVAASLLLAGLLYACGPSKHPAAAAVESYLRALVDKDEARFVGLTCKEYEADSLLQFDAFNLVKTRLEGLKCQAQDTGEAAASVTCQGQIIASYGAEDQQFDLSGRKFQVRKEGSDWLVCGQ